MQRRHDFSVWRHAGQRLGRENLHHAYIQTFIIQDRNEISGKFLQNTIYDHIFYQIWLEVI